MKNKINNNRKNIIIVVASILLIGIIAFLVFWGTTADTRNRNKKINEIKLEISEFREENKGPLDSVSFFIPNEYHTDEVFIDFLCSEIKEMNKNNEYLLLEKFVFEILIIEEVKNDAIVNTLVECFNNASTVEDALALRERFDYSGYPNIQSQMVLNRNSPPVSTYIEKNGTQPFTTTPGEGFYAEFENESYHKTIGVAGSSLYEAETITYLGDFKCQHYSGCKLDVNYQESYYDGTRYFFRDNYIPFSPSFGECVWSGDYLFCFAPDGKLLNYGCFIYD